MTVIQIVQGSTFLSAKLSHHFRDTESLPCPHSDIAQCLEHEPALLTLPVCKSPSYRVVRIFFDVIIGPTINAIPTEMLREGARKVRQTKLDFIKI